MPTIVTFDKLLATLPDSLYDPYVADARFVCVSKPWVANEFSVSWRMARMLFGLQPSSGDEATDCDDYALACKVHANRLHRMTQKRPTNTALAFGVVWYTSRFGRHAINVFWHAVGGKPVAEFYEPQTAEIVALTKSEFESINEKLL